MYIFAYVITNLLFLHDEFSDIIIDIPLSGATSIRGSSSLYLMIVRYLMTLDGHCQIYSKEGRYQVSPYTNPIKAKRSRDFAWRTIHAADTTNEANYLFMVQLSHGR